MPSTEEAYLSTTEWLNKQENFDITHTAAGGWVRTMSIPLDLGMVFAGYSSRACAILGDPEGRDVSFAIAAIMAADTLGVGFYKAEYVHWVGLIRSSDVLLAEQHFWTTGVKYVQAGIMKSPKLDMSKRSLLVSTDWPTLNEWGFTGDME